MQKLIKVHTWRFFIVGLFLTVITGCAAWNSVPVVVDQNMGKAARNLVKNQTLYPEHGQNDDPTLGLDGIKAQTVINAYRQPPKDPLEQSKQGVTFDVKNVGGPNVGN